VYARRPLFTEVPRRGILRTSRVGEYRKFGFRESDLAELSFRELVLSEVR
jgi:hypothetical protein